MSTFKVTIVTVGLSIRDVLIMFLCIDYHLSFFTGRSMKNRHCFKRKQSHKLQTTDVRHVQVAE